ncbi:MAG: tRNA preQ1(34) S-adenosylmethionine ribosyltransferase-isomerase QueA [Candidatus Berkelbacteria bacterium]
MNLSDFDYDLPKELIAQHPVDKRDESRLLVYCQKTEEIADKHFGDLIDYLHSGDVLVLNNSRVFPARLIGQKAKTGGVVEIFLSRTIDEYVWEALGKNCKVGSRITFSDSDLTAVIIEKQDKFVKVRFSQSGDKLFAEIEKIGHIPLPPYIKREKDEKEDSERYQTVYSKNIGSVAAPTAGLHFTEKLLSALRAKGVLIQEITLHVGLGTFAPIDDETIKSKKLHLEHFSISKETIEQIALAKKDGRKIVAVGTTTTRVLEYLADKIIATVDHDIEGSTDIFIQPGYKFKIIDALVTNFHLPKSSLLMLISAFVGQEKALSIYKIAVERRYRFFSYGDAMLILP